MASNIELALLVGRALVLAGILSEAELDVAVSAQSDGRLGDNLVAQGLVHREAVEAVVQARNGGTVSLEDTVFGELDDEKENFPGLRSHGSLHETDIPLFVYNAKNVPHPDFFTHNLDLADKYSHRVRSH